MGLTQAGRDRRVFLLELGHPRRALALVRRGRLPQPRIFTPHRVQLTLRGTQLLRRGRQLAHALFRFAPGDVGRLAGLRQPGRQFPLLRQVARKRLDAGLQFPALGRKFLIRSRQLCDARRLLVAGLIAFRELALHLGRFGPELCQFVGGGREPRVFGSQRRDLRRDLGELGGGFLVGGNQGRKRGRLLARRLDLGFVPRLQIGQLRAGALGRRLRRGDLPRERRPLSGDPVIDPGEFRHRGVVLLEGSFVLVEFRLQGGERRAGLLRRRLRRGDLAPFGIGALPELREPALGFRELGKHVVHLAAQGVAFLTGGGGELARFGGGALGRDFVFGQPRARCGQLAHPGVELVAFGAQDRIVAALGGNQCAVRLGQRAIGLAGELELGGDAGELFGGGPALALKARFQLGHLVLQRLHFQLHRPSVGSRLRRRRLGRQGRGDGLLGYLKVFDQFVVLGRQVGDGSARRIKLGVEFVQRVTVRAAGLRLGAGGGQRFLHRRELRHCCRVPRGGAFGLGQSCLQLCRRRPIRLRRLERGQQSLIFSGERRLAGGLARQLVPHAGQIRGQPIARRRGRLEIGFCVVGGKLGGGQRRGRGG